MNYSRAIRKDYFDDPEDTDQVIVAEGMKSVPALSPTGNWREDFRSLLVNRSPKTGRKLRPRGKSVSGMVFTPTLPKCVSILELLAIDPLINLAVVKAVQVCLHLVELLAAPHGERPDGHRRTKVVALAALQRLTDDEKEPQPHRHPHLVVLSLAWNPSERFKRVTSANLEVVAHAANLLSALFQHQVAWELRMMGYGIKQDGESFTIERFPDLGTLFNAGKRGKQAKAQAFRPKGQFAERQRYWFSLLDSEQRLTLMRRLKTFGQPTETTPSFEVDMLAAAEKALQKDFFRSAMDISAQALRATFGKPTPEPEQLARWATGELLDGVSAVKFEMEDGLWCWATTAGLAEERALTDLIRELPLAETGWVSEEHADTWWGKLLVGDRHRVAVLKADLKIAEVALLEAQTNHSVRLVQGLDQRSLRQYAKRYAAYLRDGIRVLFIQPVDAPRQSLWLNQLPAAAGVPVMWEEMPHRFNNLKIHGLDISFAPGKAVEVFAAHYSQRKSAFLMAHYDKLAYMNSEVRRLRASGSKQGRKPIKRLVLVPAQDDIRPGSFIQFRINAGGFKATELIKVVELGEEQMVVERPGGIRALLSYSYQYEVYDRRDSELERGDRIRLTRNNGDDAIKSGLRRDRRFIVKAVWPDGTALLDDDRVLPPKAGHWEYGFCLAFVDKKPRKATVVCDLEDISLLQFHGWLRPGIEIVICASNPLKAEQALEGVLAKSRMSCFLAGTDEISEDLAMAAFGYRTEVETVPVDSKGAEMASSKDTMVKSAPIGMEI